MNGVQLMTESQYRYMKKAAEICTPDESCFYDDVCFRLWVPGHSNTGKACYWRSWLGEIYRGVYYVTEAGYTALAEHEAKMEAKR